MLEKEHKNELSFPVIMDCSESVRLTLHEFLTPETPHSLSE